ncbi:MAG: hypothetical protein ACHQF3_07260 [Alphaproteobacteria bacterium]
MATEEVQPAVGSAAAPNRRCRTLALLSLAFAMAGPAGLSLLWSISFNAAFFFAFPFLALWALAAVIAFCFAVAATVSRRWLRALSISIFPLAALAAFLNFMCFWGLAIDAGETIHFFAKRAAYLAEIAKLPSDKGPRLAIFNWGGFTISHAVVYDESDEIMLPAERQSEAWKKRIAGTDLECGVWGRPVGGHFHIVRFGC